MKRVFESICELKAVTWLRVLAITGTAIFVAVMCFMDQIRRLV